MEQLQQEIFKARPQDAYRIGQLESEISTLKARLETATSQNRLMRRTMRKARSVVVFILVVLAVLMTLLILKYFGG